ncbi:ADP-ribosylation factor-related protein 1 [Trichoplax sp. H2]|uniref:ADP-ribosylation factor-like protein 6 n=1 Tax=Trichoplax adhaerens TaxID=10228 RepID=B3S2Q0_TRIAD|nr:hypothetical protein TRIADDRAFT_58105 [Trichoplax adhaerens]EDV23132.1 hypothetical protein TRIADDRAFT_58105 [Trichoplax adhaerens]RDD47842.1 ADP-ribosylation factor-related protein 1 [Trichoplax sp. H2]|eukprot:XP_002114042.1 hypothetical protein TRIADDRAFT_58105 [Trichoplax adhaerens]
MYTLLYGLWKYMFQKDEYYVLILGLDNAGKTTFLERTKSKFSRNYQSLSADKISPTVGLNIGRIDLGSIRLRFWDLGGQKDLLTLWDKYYSEAHAVIFMIDSTDKERLSMSKEAFDEMMVHPALDRVPLLVLANKQDLESAMALDEIKTIFNESLQNLGKRDFKIQPISALKSQGIHESIDWLVYCAKKNSDRPPSTREITS